MRWELPAGCGQEGVATSEELRAAGVSEAGIRYRTLERGDWQRLLPGTYLLHSGRPTWRQRFRAALVYGRTGAQLTAHAALSLYHLRDIPPPDRVTHVDILARHTRSRPSTKYVRVHRTWDLPPNPLNLEGFSCAPLPRALADAYRFARRGSGPPLPLACLYEVIQRGRHDVDELRAAFRARRVLVDGELAHVLDDLRAGAHSVAEAVARRVIAGTDLPQPLWNVDVLVDGSFVCRPDAYWPAHGVMLEIDSLRHHQHAPDFRRTMRRHNRLTALGFTVLHVTPTDLQATPEKVLSHLTKTLSTPLTPPVGVTWTRAGRVAAR